MRICSKIRRFATGFLRVAATQGRFATAMSAPFPMQAMTAFAPPARHTAVAPCRDRWTIASSIAVTTLAATRLASFELPCPSALQFNQLLQYKPTVKPL